MKRVKSIIVDDESLARTNLKKALESFEHWSVIGEFDTGEGVISAVRKCAVDVVFLDIKMPKRDGISIIKGLVELDNPPLVIFVTAYDVYAVEAFEFYALDYLLKPFSDKRFELSIRRAEAALESEQQRGLAFRNQRDYVSGAYVDRLAIKSTGSIKVIDVSDVYCFKASGNYVEICYSAGVELHRTSLGFLEEKLNPNQFVRTHRGAIVKITEIRQVNIVDEEKYSITLKNGQTVKLSGTYRQAVLDKLGAN